jgi:RNA polymerase sigma factor (sigma-70 family)
MSLTTEMIDRAKNGDPAAAETIFKYLEPQLAKLAHTMCGKYHIEDAISEARVAVWEALSTFNPDMGANFATHANKKAAMAISAFISGNNDGPTIPGRTARRYHKIMRDVSGDYNAAIKRVRESADSTVDGSEAAFKAAHDALGEVRHFDMQPAEDDAASADALEAMVPQDHSVEDTALNNALVDLLLADCDEREVLILSMTYGLGDHRQMVDAEIAEAVGISRSRVVSIRTDVQKRMATKVEAA